MKATKRMHQSSVTEYRWQFCRAIPPTIMPSRDGKLSTRAAARPAATPTTYKTKTDATLPPGKAISAGATVTRSRHQKTATDRSTAAACATVAGHRSSHRLNGDRPLLSSLTKCTRCASRSSGGTCRGLGPSTSPLPASSPIPNNVVQSPNNTISPSTQVHRGNTINQYNQSWACYNERINFCK